MKVMRTFAFISMLMFLLVSCTPDLTFEMPSWLKNEQWEKISGDSEDYIFTTSNDIQISEYATFFYSLKEELRNAQKANTSLSNNSFSLHWESPSGTGVDTEGNVFSTSAVYDVSFTRLKALEISFTYNRTLVKGDEITHVRTSGIYRRG